MLGLVLPVVSLAQSTNERVELTREVIKAEKKLLVSQYLLLTEAEAKGFWPVYESYQKELAALEGRGMELIDDYSAHYDKLTDEKAQKLLGDFITIREDSLKLKKSYLPKLKQILPIKKVARYIQLENKIEAVINFEMTGDIPLVQ